MSLRKAYRITNPRANVITTQPAVEPVTAAELRTHLRESSASLPDADANSLIADARAIVENYLNAALITQSWKLTLDRWPAGASDDWWSGVRQGHINQLHGPDFQADVEIPRWPLQSITSCTVYDSAGASSVVVVANTFDVDTQLKPGRLSLKNGATWPVALRANNAIEIAYVAGYGASGASVPTPILRAIKMLAAALYTNRGDCGADPVQSCGAASVLAQYKVAKI